MTTVAPIRKQITVPAPVDRAFDTFTAGMSRWWNPQYTIGSEPLAEVVLEPREGGRWYERGSAGAECDWGRVLVWSPPERVVLDWQITADWRYDAGVHTELDVRFTPDGPRATRVDLEHRGLEALGDGAAAIRAVFDGPGGWAGLLQRLRDEAAEAADRDVRAG